MTKSFTGLKRIRKTFGRIGDVAPMPNLIEVQKSSYDRFLQTGVMAPDRTDSGLQEAFKTVFPISDFSGRAQLEFVKYELEDPKYDVEDCQQRGMTYAAPLKVTWSFGISTRIRVRARSAISKNKMFIWATCP